MKIYLDLVFIINFIIDFFILYGVKKTLKINTKNTRILIGSIIGSISIIILFLTLNNIEIFIIKLIISILVIIVSFGKRNITKNIIYFYLISIILGGSFYLFDIGITYKNTGFMIIKNNHIFNIILLLIGTPIIIYLFVKENLSYKNTYSNKYIIKIYINKKLYKYEGIIDTGNRLVDPYKKRSVILINDNIKYNKCIYVPYHTLDYNGVIPCITPDEVIINNKISIPLSSSF